MQVENHRATSLQVSGGACPHHEFSCVSDENVSPHHQTSRCFATNKIDIDIFRMKEPHSRIWACDCSAYTTPSTWWRIGLRCYHPPRLSFWLGASVAGSNPVVRLFLWKISLRLTQSAFLLSLSISSLFVLFFILLQLSFSFTKKYINILKEWRLCTLRHGIQIQWKPFWLATQLYPQNDRTGWQFLCDL